MTGPDDGKGLPPRPGDVGRRIAHRRQELGLSRGQAADRAGMSPAYLRYVEEQPAVVDTGALLRLADALDTTDVELRGGTLDIPPGRGPATARPVLEEMSAARCWARLGSHGIGRIALSAGDAVEVLPVNYLVVKRKIAYRTTPTRAEAAAGCETVSFEVDKVDEVLRQGWSVLVTGRAVPVTDPREAGLLDLKEVGGPWAGGARPVWVHVVPARITGRSILAR